MTRKATTRAALLECNGLRWVCGNVDAHPLIGFSSGSGSGSIAGSFRVTIRERTLLTDFAQQRTRVLVCQETLRENFAQTFRFKAIARDRF